jgi:hypothetical protein
MSKLYHYIFFITSTTSLGWSCMASNLPLYLVVDVKTSLSCMTSVILGVILRIIQVQRIIFTPPRSVGLSQPSHQPFSVHADIWRWTTSSSSSSSSLLLFHYFIILLLVHYIKNHVHIIIIIIYLRLTIADRCLMHFFVVHFVKIRIFD